MFLISSTFSFAQGVDSLFNLLDKTDIQAEKVDIWNKISDEQQPSKGKEAAQNALNLAKKIDYKKGQADAHFYLGTYFYLKDQTVLAKNHFINALSIYENIEDKTNKTYTLIYLGEAFYFEEKYTTALNYLKEAEDIANEVKDNTLLAMTYQTIAYIYTDGLKDVDLAEMYLLKSISIFKKEKNHHQLVDSYNALASFYIENEQIENGLLFIKKGEDILAKLDSTAYSTYMYNSFTALKGTSYIKAGKIDTAKLFIEKSLPFFIENEHWYSVAWTYSDLSVIALQEKQYQKAISLAQNSIKLNITNFSLIDNTKTIRDAFKHLNQDSFHLYNEKYIANLADTKHTDHIKEIQKTLKKKELNNKEKELTYEKEANKKILISGLIIALLYGFLQVFKFRKNRAKKAKTTFTKSQKSTISTHPIEETEVDELRQKVHHIERSLLSKQIDIARQKSSIINTTQHLKEIANTKNPEELKRSIKKLSRQLESAQNDKFQWNVFNQQFEQIHPNFFHILRQHTPNLSTRELRLCAFAKLGMTNKEIAQVLGIATSSVNKARHRLKKKMNLNKEQDLNLYLDSVNIS